MILHRMKKMLLLLGCLFQACFSFAQLTPQQWQSDLELLKKSMSEQAPLFFQRQSKKSFEQAISDLSAKLPQLNNFQTALSIQSILARAHDGNTYAELKSLMMAENPIPFGLGYYADGIFVSGTVKKFEKAMGKKVLKINGQDIKSVVERLSMFVSSDNDLSVMRDGFNLIRFPGAFKMAGISANDTLNLLLENSSGKTELVKLYPINLKNSKDMMPLATQQEQKDLRWQPMQNYYTNHWLAEDSTLYIQYNRCLSAEMSLEAGDSISARQLPPFAPFADSIIAFLQRTPGTKLLFDLRFNTGGNPADGLRLIERIKADPNLNRKDRIFVATNLYTAGAAITIASQFGKETNAQIIGEKPGGKPNQTAGLRSFTLPNSKLTIYFPTKKIVTVKGDPDFLELDQEIPLPYLDFKTGKDPVLDFVRKK